MSVRALAILALGLLLAGAATAHVPQVGVEDRLIDQPGRSWAFYDELPENGVHVWTFDLSAGDPLFLGVAVPVRSQWAPEATLRGPDGAIPLERVAGVELEPFAPYAAEQVGALNQAAPANGSYELTISGAGGPYALGYGLTESFTLTEWVTVPLQVAQVRAWEGRAIWWVALPYIAGVVGALALVWTRTPSRPPLVQALAAGLFVGSALERGLQLALALQAGAEAAAAVWLVAGAIALPALALAWAAWRARRVWALALTGVLGLAMWAGLLLGSALMVAAMVARIARRGQDEERRGSRWRPPAA